MKARTKKSLFSFESQFRALKLRRETKVVLEVNFLTQEPDRLKEKSGFLQKGSVPVNLRQQPAERRSMDTQEQVTCPSKVNFEQGKDGKDYKRTHPRLGFHSA